MAKKRAASLTKKPAPKRPVNEPFELGAEQPPPAGGRGKGKVGPPSPLSPSRDGGRGGRPPTGRGGRGSPQRGGRPPSGGRGRGGGGPPPGAGRGGRKPVGRGGGGRGRGGGGSGRAAQNNNTRGGKPPGWMSGRKAPPRDFSFGEFDMGESMHVVHKQFGDLDNSNRASRAMYFGKESINALGALDGVVDNSERPSNEVAAAADGEKPQDGNKKSAAKGNDKKNNKQKEKKDDDDFSSKSAEQRFVLQLAKVNISPTFEVDEEEEMKKPCSDVTLGDESYILDLARQKETRKKELEEESLDNALRQYKTLLKAGGEESDEVFLTLVVHEQNKLTEEYKPLWKQQDQRLEDALQAELDRRTKESTVTLESQENAANERGNKKERVSAVIAKGNTVEEELEDYDYDEEEEEHLDDGGYDYTEEGEHDDDDTEDGNDGKENEKPTKTNTAKTKKEEEVEGSERVSEKSLVTVDLGENEKAPEEAKPDMEKKSGGGIFSALFGNKKNKQENSTDSKTTDETAPAKGSAEQPGDDNNDLNAMEQGNGDDNDKKKNTNAAQPILREVTQKKFNMLMIVGIIAFFVFDAVLLVFLFLKD